MHPVLHPENSLPLMFGSSARRLRPRPRPCWPLAHLQLPQRAPELPSVLAAVAAGLANTLSQTALSLAVGIRSYVSSCFATIWMPNTLLAGSDAHQLATRPVRWILTWSPV